MLLQYYIVVLQTPCQLSLLNFNQLLILMIALYAAQNGYFTKSIRHESGLKISILAAKGIQTSIYYAPLELERKQIAFATI